VSQEAFLCGATHDYLDPEFPMISAPITVGAWAWICARATVLPGTHVPKGTVIGLGAVASGVLEPWSVYAGVPAKKIRTRVQRPRIRAA
jgi:putative colanic acid biosynthesis acetyltransferase WcaF